MTFEQASLLILLGLMLALFCLDRFRIEVVSIAGSRAGYLLSASIRRRGSFPASASPVVITVIEILLIARVARHSF